MVEPGLKAVRLAPYQHLLGCKSPIPFTKGVFVERTPEALRSYSSLFSPPCTIAEHKHCLDRPCLQMVPLPDPLRGAQVPCPQIPLGLLQAAQTSPTVGVDPENLLFSALCPHSAAPCFLSLELHFISHCVQTSCFCAGIPLFPGKPFVFP